MCYASPDYHSPSGTNGCNHHSFQSARWQYSTPRYGLTHFSKQQNEGRHGCTQRITFEHALLHPITCQNKRTTFKTPKIRLKNTQNPPKNTQNPSKSLPFTKCTPKDHLPQPRPAPSLSYSSKGWHYHVNVRPDACFHVICKKTPPFLHLWPIYDI